MPEEVKPTDFSKSTCAVEETIAAKVRFSVTVDTPLDGNSTARELHVQNACSVAHCGDVVSEFTKGDALELLEAGNNARNAHIASSGHNAHNEHPYECAANENTSDSSVEVFTFGRSTLVGNAFTQWTSMASAEAAKACVHERTD